MASASTIRLSGNDAAVLGALFDPETSLQNHMRIGAVRCEPYDASVLSFVKNEELAALRLINAEQPSLVDIDTAIAILNKIVLAYPKYASAWNNRAQARKMRHDAVTTTEQTEPLQSIFADLAQAIALASPEATTETTSPENARVLASAHTHRGYLLWRASRPGSPAINLDGVEPLRGLHADQLEEMASREFSLGGKYGNQTAQQLAVKTNPYAKLCGSIVREALQKEITDFHQVSA